MVFLIALMFFCVLVVLFSMNMLYLVLSLLSLFFLLAGYYLLMGIEFLGIVQLMVNLGGVVVLVLFTIFLTKQEGLEAFKSLKRSLKQYIFGFFIASSVMIPVIKVVLVREGEFLNYPLEVLGQYLITDYLIPFEISSFLLLGTLIAAATLARGVKT